MDREEEEDREEGEEEEGWGGGRRIGRSTDRCCGARGRWRGGSEPRRRSNELWPGSRSPLCRKNLLEEKEEEKEEEELGGTLFM